VIAPITIQMIYRQNNASGIARAQRAKNRSADGFNRSTDSKIWADV